MNREEYIKYRGLNILTPVAYDFVRQNSDLNIDYPLFQRLFRLFVMSGSNYNKWEVVIYEDEQENEISREQQQVTYTVDWNLLWHYYDCKFNITLVHNLKTNKIIKIL